jgi:hypothetical protein
MQWSRSSTTTEDNISELGHKLNLKVFFRELYVYDFTQAENVWFYQSVKFKLATDLSGSGELYSVGVSFSTLHLKQDRIVMANLKRLLPGSLSMGKSTRELLLHTGPLQ